MLAQNPVTGALYEVPEHVAGLGYPAYDGLGFFNLGKLVSGILPSVGKIIGGALPGISNIVSSALPAIGNVVSSALPGISNVMGGLLQPPGGGQAPGLPGLPGLPNFMSLFGGGGGGGGFPMSPGLSALTGLFGGGATPAPAGLSGVGFPGFFPFSLPAALQNLIPRPPAPIPAPRPFMPGMPWHRSPWPVGWVTPALPYTGAAPRRLYMRCAVWPGQAGLVPAVAAQAPAVAPMVPGAPGPGLPGAPGAAAGGRFGRRRGFHRHRR